MRKETSRKDRAATKIGPRNDKTATSASTGGGGWGASEIAGRTFVNPRREREDGPERNPRRCKATTLRGTEAGPVADTFADKSKG